VLRVITWSVAALLVAGPLTARAQEQPWNSVPDTGVVLQGSTRVGPLTARAQEQPWNSVPDTGVVLQGLTRVAAETTADVPLATKSPGTAMLLSAVLPGAGQAYNTSYWKVPIVLGLGIYFVSVFLDSDRRADDYRQQYAASLLVKPGGESSLLSLRDFYKTQRDSFAWYFFILYFLNIVDAYVDASLYGFDVSPALNFRGVPDGARLHYSFRW
jgi:hypothetical protein